MTCQNFFQPCIEARTDLTDQQVNKICDVVRESTSVVYAITATTHQVCQCVRGHVAPFDLLAFPQAIEVLTRVFLFGSW